MNTKYRHHHHADALVLSCLVSVKESQQNTSKNELKKGDTKEMREIVSEIEIKAKPSKVWEILVDFKSYPDWNPFIRKIEGELVVGSTLEVTIKVPNRDLMTFKPEVLKANPNEELRWQNKMWARFLFAGEHYFILEPIGEESTKLIQGEKFTGILVPFLVKSSNDTPLGFIEFNRAIKKRSEQ